MTSEYSSFLFVKYPANYSRAVERLQLATNLDIHSLTTKLCRKLDHYEDLLMTTLVPLCLLVLIEVVHAICTRLKVSTREKRRNWATFWALLVLYCAYTYVSSAIFRTFECDALFKEGEPEDSEFFRKVYLRADYSKSCKSRVYRLYTIYVSPASSVLHLRSQAYLMGVIYVVRAR